MSQPIEPIDVIVRVVWASPREVITFPMPGTFDRGEVHREFEKL